MSRFVAAGASADEVYAPPTTNDAWTTAQAELDDERRRKEELSRTQQESGLSLYETLQANKAAKQEAFEEAAKLKHQFRALDDDEVDFLDSINDLTRQKEAEVRKETAEGLNLFRKKQEEAEQRAVMGDDVGGMSGDGMVGGGTEGEEQVSWVPAGGRKRKKGKGREEKEGVKGLKLRKMSSTAEDALIPEAVKPASTTSNARKQETSSTVAPAIQNTTPALSKAPSEAAAPTKASAGLGLAGYSSDED